MSRRRTAPSAARVVDRALVAVLLAVLAGCSSARAGRPSAPTPPTPATTGPGPAIAAATSAPRPRSKAELQEALARDLHDAGAYEELARLHLARSQQQPGATILARQVIAQGLAALASRGEHSASLLTSRAQLAIAAGDPRSARADLEAALQLAPGSPRALWLFGVLALELRDFASARTALTRLSRDPARRKSADVWLALGVAERGLQRFEAAEKAYQQAIALDPADPRPWFNLGLLYRHPIADMAVEFETNRMIAARRYFQTFVDLAADDPRFTHDIHRAKDIVATIDNDDRFTCYYPSRGLEVKAAEMAALQEQEDAAERTRLLELEARALADP